MKHKLTITIMFIVMFLLTQFIGLAVINAYSPTTITQVNPQTGEIRNKTIEQPLPYGMQPPELKEEKDFWKMLPQMLIAFVIAIALILILIKYKYKFIIKAWFFVVVILALSITLNAILKISPTLATTSSILALMIVTPIAWFKIYKPNILLHNITELLIYPGIAAVFVPILSVWTIILFLILISAYDIWAVNHSGIMQKMAKFQINELKVFGGFIIPHISKKLRAKIKKLKIQAKKSKAKAKQLKNKKVRISLAILGGGDVVFPIITAGIFLRAFGLVPAILIIIGALVGLTYLLLISQKKKYYPAMPFITAGIFAGMLMSLLFNLL